MNREFQESRFDTQILTDVVTKTVIDPSSIITITDISEFTRQDDEDEFEQFQEFMDAAIDYAERYLNRYLSETEVDATWQGYQSKIILPFKPNEIISLNAYNLDTEEYEEIDFKFNSVSGVLRINVEDYHRYYDFTCSYKCGWTVDEIPNAVKHGIRKLIATMYESREDEIYGVSINQSDFNHKRWFDLYRLRTVQ